MKLKTLLLFIILHFFQQGNAQILKPLQAGVPDSVILMNGEQGDLLIVYKKRQDQNTITYGIKHYFQENMKDLHDVILNPQHKLNAITRYKSEVYIAGLFDSINGGFVNNIAVLKPNGWQKILDSTGAFGVNGEINDLHSKNKYGLVAAGAFTLAGNVSANRIASYEEGVWKAFGSGIGGTNPVVRDIEFNPRGLWVAGDFISAGGNQSNGLANYDTSGVWKARFDTLSKGIKIGLFNQILMVYGIDSFGTRKIMRIDLSGAESNSTSGINVSGNLDFAYEPARNITYATGLFIESQNTSKLATYNGTGWTLLQNELSTYSISQLEGNSIVYAGGNFSNNDGVSNVLEIAQKTAKVHGTIFIDHNLNCQKEVDDEAVINYPVHLEEYTVFTDKTGRYVAFVHADSVYKIFPVLDPIFAVDTCADSSIFQTLQSETTYQFDFPLVKNNILRKDLSVELIGGTGWRARRGFTEEYFLIIRNTGNEKISLSSITVNIDSRLQNFNPDRIPDNVNGNLYTWNLLELKPFDRQIIQFDLVVPITTTIGDTLKFISNISSSEDNYTVNNSYNLNQVIRSALDPNDKQVYPNGTDQVAELGPWTKDLEYLIRFENIGTDTAYTVYVYDTVDVNLGIREFQTTSTSHEPYKINVLPCHPGRGKGVILWTFPKIKLPPAKPGNKEYTDNRGYIKYSVRMKNPFALGTEIHNQANIYFDYEAPVITNKVKVIIVQNPPSSVEDKKETEENTWNVYPVPASDIIKINNVEKNAFEWKLYSSNGIEINSGNVDSENEGEINVSNVAAGLYLIKISDRSGKAHIRKIIIQ